MNLESPNGQPDKFDTLRDIALEADQQLSQVMWDSTLAGGWGIVAFWGVVEMQALQFSTGHKLFDTAAVLGSVFLATREVRSARTSLQSYRRLETQRRDIICGLPNDVQDWEQES